MDYNSLKESDLSTLLDQTGRQTIDLLRNSKIENDMAMKKWEIHHLKVSQMTQGIQMTQMTKFKFLADFVEKTKLKKRKMTGVQKDAKVPSKKARKKRRNKRFVI